MGTDVVGVRTLSRCQQTGDPRTLTYIAGEQWQYCLIQCLHFNDNNPLHFFSVALATRDRFYLIEGSYWNNMQSLLSYARCVYITKWHGLMSTFSRGSESSRISAWEGIEQGIQKGYYSLINCSCSPSTIINLQDLKTRRYQIPPQFSDHNTWIFLFLLN